MTPTLSTADEILSRLEPVPEQVSVVRSFVLEAEAISFSDEQKLKLCSILRTFIERQRDSQDPQDLVAVAAAIRKLIAIMPADNISLLTPLLEAGHRATVPLEIELEIAKMVAWRLSQSPPNEGDAVPELAARLMELVRLYLHDRLLPRKGYAATALNAVLALLLMRVHVDEIIKRLHGLRSHWFNELVARRVADLKYDLERRMPPAEIADLLTVLQKVASALSAESPA